jgi:hypothetical protein
MSGDDADFYNTRPERKQFTVEYWFSLRESFILAVPLARRAFGDRVGKPLNGSIASPPAATGLSRDVNKKVQRNRTNGLTADAMV